VVKYQHVLVPCPAKGGLLLLIWFSSLALWGLWILFLGLLILVLLVTHFFSFPFFLVCISLLLSPYTLYFLTVIHFQMLQSPCHWHLTFGGSVFPIALLTAIVLAHPQSSYSTLTMKAAENSEVLVPFSQIHACTYQRTDLQWKLWALN
jgi:hypothetical protein